MKAITLLTRSGGADLTPEEDAQLTRELADAYHMDEASATSRDVQRIAEKVRARMNSATSRYCRTKCSRASMTVANHSQSSMNSTNRPEMPLHQSAVAVRQALVFFVLDERTFAVPAPGFAPPPGSSSCHGSRPWAAASRSRVESRKSFFRPASTAW